MRAPHWDMADPSMRVRYRDRIITLKEASVLSGLSCNEIAQRLRRKWTVEQALETPSLKRRL